MAPALEGTNFEANRRPAPDLNISGHIASFRPHFAPGADFSTPVITNAVLSADDLPSLPALALRRLPDARGGNRRAAVPALRLAPRRAALRPGSPKGVEQFDAGGWFIAISS